MQVNPAASIGNQKAASIGYVGGTVCWIAQKIMSLFQPFFFWIGWHFSPPLLEEAKSLADLSFEVALLDGVQKGFVAPGALLRQFKKYVSSRDRDRIYEHLGKRETLPSLDRVLNAFWRNPEAVLIRYREIGRLEAERDPYRISLYLEKALQKKIDRK